MAFFRKKKRPAERFIEICECIFEGSLERADQRIIRVLSTRYREPSINKATARASFRVRSRLPRCAFQPFQVKIGLIRAFVLSLTHIFNPGEWNCIEASANVHVFRVQSKDTREDSSNFCSYSDLSVYIGNCSFQCKFDWSCYEKFHFHFLSIPQHFGITLLHSDCRYENMRNSLQI